VGRDVNRHHYTVAEVTEALARPVVAALCRLIRFRNRHPAFGGDVSVSGSGSAVTMAWEHGLEAARLDADLATRRATLTWTEDGATRHAPSLAELAGPYAD